MTRTASMSSAKVVPTRPRRAGVRELGCAVKVVPPSRSWDGWRDRSFGLEEGGLECPPRVGRHPAYPPVLQRAKAADAPGGGRPSGPLRASFAAGAGVDSTCRLIP